MLTLELLKQMNSGQIIASGVTTNDKEGIYMTDSRIGDELLWVAKRGIIHDWCIYCYWNEGNVDVDYVMDHGQKVISPENIKKLVPCDDEAFKMYRY